LKNPASSERLTTALALSGLIALGCAARAPVASEPATAEASRPKDAATEPSSTAERFDPDGTLFLSAIPLRASQGAKDLVVASKNDDEFARALRVRVEIMQSYKDLGELSRRAKLPVVNGTFQISDLSHLGSRDTPSKRDQASSFVVDFDEASFKGPVAELEHNGQAHSAEAIRAYASQYISEKNYAHSFDIASRVATSHSGDCTEHAVFTAALLRRFGFKARVVLGIVLVGVAQRDAQPELLAFGHAWVESYADDRWKIVDAALGSNDSEAGARPTVSSLPAGTSVRLVYLPINVMKDESASFARALMDQVGVESVVGLEVDASGRVK
jgi:hypothetical protein